jgi:hypothetical protein
VQQWHPEIVPTATEYLTEKIESGYDMNLTETIKKE